MRDCCPFTIPGLSEQWASPGPQAREEGPEGQSDPGGPPGVVLQHLATFFHHQHGAGKKCRKPEVICVVFLLPPPPHTHTHNPPSSLTLVACLWLTSCPYFIHASVRRVLKPRKNARQTTLGDRSIFVLTSFRITALPDWHLGFLSDSFQCLECTNTI